MVNPVVSVLFVCLGNICRSPTAHGVFWQMVCDAGLDESIMVDSCGTGDWHLGHAPDPRATHEAAQRGYDLSDLRARRVCSADFDSFDYILAMDGQNLSDLRQMAQSGYDGYLGFFLDFSEAGEQEVPDPYYGAEDGFTQVLELIEDASRGLLREISSARQLR